MTATMNPSTSTAETASSIRKLLSDSSLSSKQQNTLTQQQLSEKQEAHRLDELRRIFAALVQRGDLTWNCHLGSSKIKQNEHKSSTDVAKQKWSKWLQMQHQIFVDQLCDRVLRSKKYALRILMGVIATSVTRDAELLQQHYTKQHYHETSLKTKLMRKLLNILCECGTDPRIVVVDYESLVHLFVQEFVKSFKDVQYITCIVLKDLANKYCEEMESFQKESTEEDGKVRVVKQKLEHIIFILERVPLLIETSQEQLDEMDQVKGMLIFTPQQKRSDIEKDDSSDDSSAGESDLDGIDTDSEDEGVKVDGKGKGASDKRNTQVKTKKEKKNDRSMQAKSFSLAKQKLALAKSWLATLPFTSVISSGVHKRVLVHLSINILPYVNNPLQFAQYFTAAYQQQTGQESTSEEGKAQLSFSSSATACLALEGLFILMTRHGLEYPQFFTSLYALVQPSVFYAKHRTTFFRLLSQCLLSSQMLPAYLVAAMCKRLCRCALAAPPSGALYALALTSNLIRRHKACRCLVHRSVSSETGTAYLEDVFEPTIQDPLKSRGM
jgi:hypothetical protein